MFFFFFFFSFFSFFCQPYPGLRNWKSVFLILKISQYGGSRWRVQLFPRYQCKNLYKNWYLYFYKTYGHQIWQVGTSIGFDLNETNQADAGDIDVIMSISRDKLITLYLHYHRTIGIGSMATKPGKLITNLDGLQPLKSHNPLIIRSCKITWQTKIIISPLPECLDHQTWQDRNLPCWAPAYNVKWPFDHMVLWDHVTN